MANIKDAIIQAISQALDTMGLESGNDSMYGDDDSGNGDNGVPIWSQLQSTTPLGQSGGIIHDKAALYGSDQGDSMAAPAQTDAYGMPLPTQDDQEEMMSGMGLV